MALPQLAVEVFCSYAPEDEQYREQLETHLSALKRRGLISLWHNQQILPGANRAKTIDQHLETASIILLLISADFIASNYCYSIEMGRALKRHKAGSARVIPVVVRACDWQQLPLASYQALPPDGKPINVWASPDEAWTQVAVGIRRIIEDLGVLSVWNILYPHNPSFVSAFETLVRERTREFVGRDYIFAAIDSGLKDPQFPSGYIVLTGKPGIGKTALLAQLVKQKGYIHHFNIAPQNIRTAKDFLSNVYAQLIARYELNYKTIPSEAMKNSWFLSRLLEEAAKKAQDEDEPVVILIDALDEAEEENLPNRLYLPPALPDKVLFIVTIREKDDFQLTVDRRKDIYIDEHDPKNTADVRQYIQQFVETNRGMGPQIRQWRVSTSGFIDILAEKSEGNFMYLVYVLRDIRDGKLTSANIDNIQNLPQGLQDYYKQHWRIMRALDSDRFRDLYEPIVCTLAVVREPVTTRQLIEWTRRIVGVELTPMRVQEVIREWREFLHENQSDRGVPLYRIYHTSFQDFLRKEVGLTPYDNNIVLTAFDKINWQGINNG